MNVKFAEQGNTSRRSVFHEYLASPECRIASFISLYLCLVKFDITTNPMAGIRLEFVSTSQTQWNYYNQFLCSLLFFVLHCSHYFEKFLFGVSSFTGFMIYLFVRSAYVKSPTLYFRSSTSEPHTFSRTLLKGFGSFVQILPIPWVLDFLPCECPK